MKLECPSPKVNTGCCPTAGVEVTEDDTKGPSPQPLLLLLIFHRVALFLLDRHKSTPIRQPRDMRQRGGRPLTSSRIPMQVLVAVLMDGSK